MPPPTTGDGDILYSDRPAGRPAINTYFAGRRGAATIRILGVSSGVTSVTGERGADRPE